MGDLGKTTGQSELPWQYKLHEEMIFYERLNFFLVAESMLLVAYTTLLGAKDNHKTLLISLSTLGIVLSLVWIFVSARQLYVIDYVSDVCLQRYPEYAEIRKERKAPLLSSTKLLAYAVPIMVLVTWLVTLVVV